jgi:hypothetical protein
MFGLFKKNRKKKKSNVQFVDLNGNILKEGDIVLSHRYELGNCVVKVCENGYEYESLKTQKKVNWALMIDAATDRQKVEKVE